jgi:Fe2+ or Zn2+ uptake regulation protein
VNPVKIQGKFYPLQHQEWLRACRELTKAEIEVLYYLRTLDPRDNGVEVSAAAIARDLSTPEKIVHRQTVSRALKRLDALGFIHIEPLVVKVNVKPKGYWCSADVEEPSDEEQPSEEAEAVCGDTSGVWRHQRCVETPQGAVTHHDGSPDTAVDRDTPEAIATHQPKTESPTQSESENPKINKNYLDFIRSLSEGERENFLNFGLEKCKSLPKKPALPMKWIEANWEELRSQWEKTEVGRRALNTQTDWTTHPNWSEWLDFMRNRGVPTFVALGEWFDRKTRRAIADWADERGLIWGAEL